MNTTHCPACGALGRSHVITARDHELWRCLDCRLVYCDPLPIREALAAAYSDAYQGATTGYFSKVESKLKRSRHRMGQILRLKPPRPGQLFLDIGCNGGFMVQAAIEAGLEGHGLDPDGVSIAYAKAHVPQGHFVHAFLEDFSHAEPFDYVYCSEVLEHAPDPHRFLGTMRGLMAPGGVVYLTTPDIDHPLVPRDLNHWDGFCPPDHCLYFSRASLGPLLKRHGFEVIKWRFAWKPGIKLLAKAV